jgi:nucleoside 2-deoxyribosyltransferase
MNRNGVNIYLAAPLFSPIERERNRRLRDLMLEFGNVYLPQEDGGLIFDFVAEGTPVEKAKHRVFDVDIKAILHCDILVILLDGRSVDEGASFELGYAFGIGKTCVGLKTDARSLFSFGDNPMIECALQHIFTSDQELADWLRKCNYSAERR